MSRLQTGEHDPHSWPVIHQWRHGGQKPFDIEDNYAIGFATYRPGSTTFTEHMPWRVVPAELYAPRDVAAESS